MSSSWKKGDLGFLEYTVKNMELLNFHFQLFLDELRQNFFWSFAWESPIEFGLVLPVFSKNSVTVVCS